jgi:uncharacterized protein YggE
MMRSKFLLSILSAIPFSLTAQQSGNNVIGQYNNQAEKPVPVSKLYLSDTSFVVQANVMLNTQADSYVATFAVAESDASLVDANSKIDKRIADFTAALTRSGIQSADIYVDMTTQNELSDYKINGNYAEQYVTGYEQKKNVIVRFSNIKDLDKMVIAASGFGIYDLAKVDYVVSDISKIYTQLFTAATDVISAKRDMYARATSVRLLPSAEIYGESFSSLTPSNLYKSYTPNTSTVYYDYGTYSKRKDLKRNTTYYFDRSSYSGYNKVINPVVIGPAVEFMLTLQVKYEIEKNKN